MSSVAQNWFEIERRAILWSNLTTLNDGTTSLGWDDDPNDVVNGSTPGESWLYSLPIGQFYKQSTGELWWKKESPNTWMQLGLNQSVIWLKSVISQIDFTTSEPAFPSEGDRHINTVTGTSNETSISVTENNIYEWDGSDWVETVIIESNACYDKNENTIFAYTGTEWTDIGAQSPDIDGSIFIDTLTPDTGNIDATMAENDTRVTSAVASPDVTIITVGVFAYAAEGSVRPSATINGTSVTWTTDPQKEPKAYFGNVDITGGPFTYPLEVKAVHQDGTEYTISITEDVAPTISSVSFTGGYPGTQTELKENDQFDIQVQSDIAFVEVEVENSGACKAQTVSPISTTDHTFTTIIANQGTISSTQAARVRVKKSTGTWSDWVYTSAGGSVNGTNTVELNNLYPSVESMGQSDITYPGGQEAIKDSETVTVHSTCANYDTIAYTSPGNEVSIPNSATYAENKSGVERISGNYNITTANYQIEANKSSNDATTIQDVIVYIAHAEAEITMTEDASRLRTGGNDGTFIQDHTITLTSNQNLMSTPTIAACSANGGSWNGTFSGGPKVYTRIMQCHDSNDNVGSYSYQTLSATNLANKETTTYTGSSAYTIGGFVSRGITLAAFANEANFGAAVVDFSKCTLSWNVKSLPNKRAYNTTSTPDADSWTFAGTLNSQPTTVRILDTAAAGNSSNESTLTVEESV